MAAPAKPTLYDVPVSNNGARVRAVIYWKGLESEFDVKPPTELGGLRSDEYLALNPQGKMPLLCLPSGLNLPESEVISQYLVHKYQGQGPDLVPADPEARAVANLATRIHDTYITSIQGVMYKGEWDIAKRAETLAELNMQMDVVEGVLSAGPYIAGAEPSTADAALFPTWIFIDYILTKYFGWSTVFDGRPKLEAWYGAMKADPVGARVYEEVHGGLEGWTANDRWDKLAISDQVKDTSYKWAYP